MKSRVELLDGHFTSFNIDWFDLVWEPMNLGYFIQAFASADALIDQSLGTVLRYIYHDHSSQDLINQLHLINGIRIAQILKKKSIITSDLLNRIQEFKRSRNIILHNPEAEYKLVSLEEFMGIKDQLSYDLLASEKARGILRQGHDIFNEMWQIPTIHSKN